VEDRGGGGDRTGVEEDGAEVAEGAESAVGVGVGDVII